MSVDHDFKLLDEWNALGWWYVGREIGGIHSPCRPVLRYIRYRTPTP